MYVWFELGTVAGVLAFWLIPAVGHWIYPDHKFGRMLIVYGAATGTLATRVLPRWPLEDMAPSA